jgi:hypothetical protein
MLACTLASIPSWYLSHNTESMHAQRKEKENNDDRKTKKKKKD